MEVSRKRRPTTDNDRGEQGSDHSDKAVNDASEDNSALGDGITIDPEEEGLKQSTGSGISE